VAEKSVLVEEVCPCMCDVCPGRYARGSTQALSICWLRRVCSCQGTGLAGVGCLFCRWTDSSVHLHHCCCVMQTQLDAINGWEIDRTMERAMDALRCPPGDALVRQRFKDG
jgi:hypothetical protein